MLSHPSPLSFAPLSAHTLWWGKLKPTRVAHRVRSHRNPAETKTVRQNGHRRSNTVCVPYLMRVAQDVLGPRVSTASSRRRTFNTRSGVAGRVGKGIDLFEEMIGGEFGVGRDRGESRRGQGVEWVTRLFFP